MNSEQQLQNIVNIVSDNVQNVTDGNHTFNELYEYRKIYNAALFNSWHKNGEYEVYKSMRHSDGQVCFSGMYFIVIAILPSGQISNHYPIQDWNLFKVPSVYKPHNKFDGHTSQDVVERLKSVL